MIRLIISILLVSSLSYAKEEILDYQVFIKVLSNSLIEVREDIKVQSKGIKIKRGIFRSIPTRRFLQQKDFSKKRTSYDIIVQDVLLNGKPETYHTKKKRGYLHIYAGRSDKYISRGIHQYSLIYLVSSQIERFTTHDRLYWNITGNQWDFPINNIEAIVSLPNGARIHKYSAWSGPKGAKGTDFRFTELNGHEVQVSSTRPYKPKEGLTIMVNFDSNVIGTISKMELLKLQYVDQKRQLESVRLGFFILIYFLITWYFWGKDPRISRVRMVSTAPKNYSPGTLRYIYNMGWDQEVFTSNIISLACKRYIIIDDKGSKPTLILNKDAEHEPLTKDEKILANELFKEGSSVTISKTNQKIIKKAVEKLKDYLKKNIKKNYFNTNFLLNIPPTLMILYYVYKFRYYMQPNIIFIVSIFYVISLSINVGINSVHMKRVKSKSRFKLLFVSLFLINHNGIFFFGFAQSGVPMSLVIIMVFNIILTTIFNELMKKPTYRGQRLINKISAFKRYLKHNNPQKISKLAKRNPIKHFGQNLAYAFALGVRDAWVDSFEDDLDDAQRKDSPYYNTYHNHPNHDIFGSSDSITSFCSSLSSSVASSGGSSSGGSSGGGGGGGGGGGW